MNKVFISLSCYVTEESSVFVAQCIEKDFCAQGTNKWDAVFELAAVVNAQLMLDKNNKRWPLESTPEPPKNVLSSFEEKKIWFTEFRAEL